MWWMTVGRPRLKWTILGREKDGNKVNNYSVLRVLILVGYYQAYLGTIDIKQTEKTMAVTVDSA